VNQLAGEGKRERERERVSIMCGDTYYVLRVDCTGCAEGWSMAINSRERSSPLPPSFIFPEPPIPFYSSSRRNARYERRRKKREREREREGDAAYYLLLSSFHGWHNFCTRCKHARRQGKRSRPHSAPRLARDEETRTRR